MTEPVDIYDPDGYVAGPPHAVFEELRRTSPVHWQDMPGQPGYWAVLKHADVMHVAREPVLFSASEGGVVLEDLDPPTLEMMRHMLLAMDPRGTRTTGARWPSGSRPRSSPGSRTGSGRCAGSCSTALPTERWSSSTR